MGKGESPSSSASKPAVVSWSEFKRKTVSITKYYIISTSYVIMIMGDLCIMNDDFDDIMFMYER